jgi:uncharacterized membrane protein YfcA
MSPIELLIAGLSAVAAGAVNALAGGGTLISFPVLIALGVPPISANITNAVALCPGYFGATLAQLNNLHGQRPRLIVLIPASILGGVAGGVILVRTGERTFTALVPWMIMAGAMLLAIQEPVRAMVLRRSDSAPQRDRVHSLTVLAIAAASIYGGFFSAGMSVLLVAVLGLTLADTFTRINALKQVLAFNVNAAAVVYFLWSEHVVWSAAAVMAIGALLGGALGGRIAARMKPSALRWTIVTLGVCIAVAYGMRTA